MKRKPYEYLHLLPILIADTVVNREYTGQEWSLQVRDYGRIQVLEAKRKELTDAQQQEFCDLCDARCRQAYGQKAKWFDDCLKGEQGRDQLYIWITHWLASYLANPDCLRRKTTVLS